jgi:mono/diheme cytochrome c family protein
MDTKDRRRFTWPRTALCAGALGLVVGFAPLSARAGEPVPPVAPVASGEKAFRENAFVAQAVDGKRIYDTLCSACHQAEGTGVHGLFPPLAGSDWVTGHEGRLIRVVLQGVTGEIVVGGHTYNGTMPPFGGALKDAEAAAVLNYIRSNWGNDAPPISTAAVARVRAATAQRRTPWTGPELNEIVKQN